MSRRHHAVRSSAFETEVGSRPSIEIVRRVARYLRPYPWMAVGTILCAVLSLAAAFAYPKLTRVVIDDVIGRSKGEALAPAMLGVLAAFLLRDVFNSLRIRLNNVLEQDVIYDIRREVYDAMQRLPVGWFDQRASGDLMTRVIEDVNSMERLLIDGTEQGVVALLSILGIAIVLFASQPALAAVALVPLPLLAGGALWYTLTAHKRYREQRVASSAMNALLMDNLQGIRQIKAFGAETQEEGRFAHRADALRRGTLRVMKVWSVYHPAMTFAGSIGTVFVLWLGGRRVLDGQMTIGQLLEFVFYLGMFYTPVGQLHSLNQMLQSARAAGERIFDILDSAAEFPGGQMAPPSGERVRGDVEYDDVTFAYVPGRSVLENISFKAAPGQVIALVGPTGAGKSSLVNLLPRFYRPVSGRVLVDGRDIQSLDLAFLRRQIAVVSQEPFLFNGTLRENLLFGCPTATDADLEAAVRAANCDEFIRRLPDGLDSLVGERGVRLSVGEKQRVSIARALLKDCPILILDEATASVDTATEALIQQALERLMRNRTSFVIAHRLSTIRSASRILVLSGGRIVETGTHEQLLSAGGLYARLWRVQVAASEAESLANR